MIDWLQVAKSAYFYTKVKRLPKGAITELYRSLRQNYSAPSQNLFHHIKEPLVRGHWSAICFSYERSPAFLEAPSGRARERVFGFIFLFEYRDYVVVFKSGLELPSEFKSSFLGRVSNERVECAIARVGTTFEKIRLRNMATSKHSLRSKTLEANDLQSVVGPSGASRYIPQGYRVRQGDDHYSASPNSGRISLRSDRCGHEELARWSAVVIDRLIDLNNASSDFIRTFARPMDLGALPATSSSTYLAMNIPALIDQLFETDVPLRLVRKVDEELTVLQKPEVEAILNDLDQTFLLRLVRGTTYVVDPRNNHRVGTVVIGKTRISLRKIDLASINNIFIESAAGPIGQSDDYTPLKRFIDRNDLFTVLFSDFTLAYVDGGLYRDNLLTEGGGAFLRYIRAAPSLNDVTSEKGTFQPGIQSFEANSVFRAIVDILADDEILVCDDLGDEWADFIGISTNANPKKVSFYHAKHAALSLGASHLHVVVSQAIKNLGRMVLSPETIAAKLALWPGAYVNNNAQTHIARVIRGNVAAIEQAAENVRTAPDTIRRVFIVTSSLSRQQLQDAFTEINAGAAPRPHFVQLYWLLMSYFSACTEVGAYPYIVCRE